MDTALEGPPTQPGMVPELVEMVVKREEVRKKRSRSLSVPSSDMVGGPNVQDLVLHDRRVGQHQGALMETLISRDSGSFSPLA